MAITRYAGDRFTADTGDIRPTGVLLGAFLINTGNRNSYVKTGNSSNDLDWSLLQGGGGGGTPADPDTSVQFNNNGSFGGDADLTFTNGNRLNVNKLGISGNVYDSNNWVGEGGMLLTNEGATGVNWKSIESVISGVGGSGVANYVARWSDEDTLTSGVIQDNATTIGINIAPDAGNMLSIKSKANNENVLSLTSSDGDGLFNVRQSANDCLIRGYKDGNVQNIQLHSDGVSYLKGGSVGIGITNPAAKLVVKGEQGIKVISDGSDNAGAALNLSHANNNTNDTISTIYFSNNTGSVARIEGHTVEANNNGEISFSTENAGSADERMRITYDGKVGIGTTEPQSILHIYGNYISIGDGTYAAALGRGNSLIGGQEPSDFVIASLSSKDLVLSAGDADRLHIQSDGKVGIGTGSPTTPLEIAGGNGNAPMSLLTLYNNDDNANSE